MANFLILIGVVCSVFAVVWHRKNLQGRVRPDEAFIWRIAFEKTALGMAVVRPDLTFVDINPSYCRMLGYTKEELMKRAHKDLVHPEDQEKGASALRELLLGHIDSFQSMQRYLHKQGTIVWVNVTDSLVRDTSHHPQFLVTQIHDITYVKNTEEALTKAKARAEMLASIDYLTGCLNRRAFMARIGEELARAKRNQTGLSIILVDIDDFKSINDLYGHLAGDTVLRHFTECLGEITRTYDFISRFGGEEFIVCLPETEIQDAYQIAERMRKSVEQMKTEYEGALIQITGSFGVVASDPEAEEPIQELIARADQAMYEAKTIKNMVYKSA